MAKAHRKSKPPQSPREIADELVSARERRGLASPTPERIVMAGGDLDTLQAEQGAARDQCIRVPSDPLDRLYKRGLLHRDEEMNEILHSAGLEYRGLWWRSGLGRSCSSMNISGVFLPAGERNPGMPVGEHQAHCRVKWRQAREVLGFYFNRVIDPIVLDGDDVEAVGRLVTGRTDSRQSSAVAVDRLSEGLRILAVHFALLRA